MEWGYGECVKFNGLAAGNETEKEQRRSTNIGKLDRNCERRMRKQEKQKAETGLKGSRFSQ